MIDKTRNNNSFSGYAKLLVPSHEVKVVSKALRAAASNAGNGIDLLVKDTKPKVRATEEHVVWPLGFKSPVVEDTQPRTLIVVSGKEDIKSYRILEGDEFQATGQVVLHQNGIFDANKISKKEKIDRAIVAQQEAKSRLNSVGEDNQHDLTKEGAVTTFLEALRAKTLNILTLKHTES